MAPFNRPCTTCCQAAVVSAVLSCTIFEIFDFDVKEYLDFEIQASAHSPCEFMRKLYIAAEPGYLFAADCTCIISCLCDVWSKCIIENEVIDTCHNGNKLMNKTKNTHWWAREKQKTADKSAKSSPMGKLRGDLGQKLNKTENSKNSERAPRVREDTKVHTNSLRWVLSVRW